MNDTSPQKIPQNNNSNSSYFERLENIIRLAERSTPRWSEVMQQAFCLADVDEGSGLCLEYPKPWGNHAPDDWFAKNFVKYLYDPRSIAEYAVDYRPYGGPDISSESGVYFLLQGEEIIYVGKAANILQRLRRHWGDKKFRKVWYLEGIPNFYIEQIETFYAHLLQPCLNCRFIGLHRELKKVLGSWGVDTSTQY